MASTSDPARARPARPTDPARAAWPRGAWARATPARAAWARAAWARAAWARATLLALSGAAAVAAAGCGDNQAGSLPADAGPADPGFPDLEAVEPVFAPAPVTVAQAVGISFHFPEAEDPAADARRDFALDQLSGAGIATDRSDLLWNLVEPDKGQRDFSHYQDLFDRCLAAGVMPLPILSYGTPWASPSCSADDTACPPDDPADFGGFAGAAAALWRGRIDAYEVWNEEDLGFRFWHPAEDPAGYGDLLRAASRGIRAADPAARVVLGGLIYQPLASSGAERYLEDLYRARPGIGAAFDVLALHPYAVYPPHSPPDIDLPSSSEVSVQRMVARVRRVMTFYGEPPDKPIWVTEIGWPIYQAMGHAVDEDQQARWLVRAVLSLLGAGVSRVYWYTLVDDETYLDFPPEGAFGLWRYDDPADGYAPAPKKSWQALTTLLSLAGDLAVSEDVTAELTGAPADAIAYRLKAPLGPKGRQVTVVWRTDESAGTRVVSVPVPADAQVTLFDLVGQPVAGDATALAIGPDPIYVVATPGS